MPLHPENMLDLLTGLSSVGVSLFALGRREEALAALAETAEASGGLARAVPSDLPPTTQRVALVEPSEIS